MDATEIAGEGVDGDFDGVVNELTVGDMTALAVYLGSQPRPTTLIELNSFGLIDPLPQDQVDSINRGSTKFAQIGCGSCHVATLTLNNPTFSEPSQDPNYRDPSSPSAPKGGLGAVAEMAVNQDQADFTVQKDPLTPAVDVAPRTLDPALAIHMDLTHDQPDNQVKDAAGNVIYRLGSLRTDSNGKAMVELYGDLKRHFMGNGLAEGVDEVGTGAATFLTENLWGVGTTPPYMHDGRATTLTEAILEHGGEASDSRTAFRALSTNDQKDVIAFLNNLVLFKMED
jgi:cytochrome c peroxidase